MKFKCWQTRRLWFYFVVIWLFYQDKVGMGIPLTAPAIFTDSPGLANEFFGFLANEGASAEIKLNKIQATIKTLKWTAAIDLFKKNELQWTVNLMSVCVWPSQLVATSEYVAWSSSSQRWILSEWDEPSSVVMVTFSVTVTSIPSFSLNRNKINDYVDYWRRQKFELILG